VPSATTDEFSSVPCRCHATAARAAARASEPSPEPAERPSRGRRGRARRKDATEHFVSPLAWVISLIGLRDGIFAGTNNLVEVICGTPALSVEQIVTANRDAFTTAGQAPAWEKVRA